MILKSEMQSGNFCNRFCENLPQLEIELLMFADKRVLKH